MLKINTSNGKQHLTEFIFFFFCEILHVFHCIFATPTKHKTAFHVFFILSQIES